MAKYDRWDAETVRQAGRRILYVEDEDELRRLVARVLTAERYQVTDVCTAEAGLEALGRKPHGLVITDYALPGRNGGWLLSEARSRGLIPPPNAIIVTGAPDAGDVGGALVLRKPVDLDLLVAEASAMLEAVAWSAGRRPRSGIERRIEPGAEVCQILEWRQRRVRGAG
jgi:DNA-binding response OmpR family regulator